MRKLIVQIELNGNLVYVGDIVGNHSDDASFTYADSYISDSDCRPISISLPLERKSFDPIATRD